MEYKDYYQIMGVARDAGQDEIKRAYRKLARKYHPDVSKEPNAEARFKEVGEAYEVLKDPEKRAAYDQLGANWQAGQEFRPPPGWDAGFEFRGDDTSGPGAEAFSDFFESLFGRGFRTGRGGEYAYRERGEDHHAKVLIDIADAYHGARKNITLRASEFDSQGRLQVRERSLNVQIPKGIKQGQKIRLSGQGAAGQAGAGDLYLEVEFNPHAWYRPRQRDIYMDVPVAPWEAALGAKIKIPTPGGPVELRIPANMKSGGKLRLKGRGIPGNPPGDILVTPQVVLPPADDDKARQLYRSMQSELAFNPRSHFGVQEDE